ncbi:MAG: GSCFA domain-containing protein [Ginsengibacter sp.]
MEFILPFQSPSFPFHISFKDKILLMGSCFSEEIGNKLKSLKFDIIQNPNGILYDPLSISDALFSYIENKPFEEKNLFQLNGLWHSWQHHSVFSGLNKERVLQKINDSRSCAHVFLKSATCLFITFGTAFNYLLKNNSQNVANCHKAPANFFIKNLLPVEEIRADLQSVITALERFNPQLKIIFTVSPVKHIKDGIIENSHSKARLIEAAHVIAEEKENAFYFPSYEIVTDVLRDYRFFKKDLVHPNEMATDFVFEKFSESFFNAETKSIINKIEKVRAAVNHKPFEKESEEHQKFLLAQIENIDRLQREFPFINLSDERQYFQSQLK